jgi:hypothetical protein
VKNSVFVFLMMILATGCRTDQTSDPLAAWKSFQIPEYNLEFKYPPDAGAKENKIPFFRHDAEEGVSRGRDGLSGEVTIDGLHQWPYSIKLDPELTFESGIVFNFPIRFIMLTDAAKLDPMWAKEYGWNEAPKISMYPFDFEQDKQSMLLAVECLYLERPRAWEKTEPITVDGKTGMKMSDWDMLGKNYKYFEEIVTVPVFTNKILIIHAGYYPKPQPGFLPQPEFVTKLAMELKIKQQIFSNVVSSVKFLEK